MSKNINLKKSNCHSFLFEQHEGEVFLSEMTQSSYKCINDKTEIEIASADMEISDYKISISYLKNRKEEKNNNVLMLKNKFHYYFLDKNNEIIFYDKNKEINELKMFFKNGAVLIGKTQIYIDNEIINIFYVKNKKIKHFGN